MLPFVHTHPVGHVWFTSVCWRRPPSPSVRVQSLGAALIITAIRPGNSYSRPGVGDPPALEHVLPQDGAAQSARFRERGLDVAQLARGGRVAAGHGATQQLQDEPSAHHLLSQRRALQVSEEIAGVGRYQRRLRERRWSIQRIAGGGRHQRTSRAISDIRGDCGRRDGQYRGSRAVVDIIRWRLVLTEYLLRSSYLCEHIRHTYECINY